MGEKENKNLVKKLVDAGYLSKPKIIEAFKKVDREKFVPNKEVDYAYFDEPLPIGSGQTISAPSMVAIMTEKLDPHIGQKILEIGAGSGYQAAILAEIVGETGKIYTIERIEEIAEIAKRNLRNYENVKVIVGDGTLGYEREAPYDRIMVTAAAPKVPQPLIKQLKRGGIMAIPVGAGFWQEFILVKKDRQGKVSQEFVCGCAFVPLIGKYGHNQF